VDYLRSRGAVLPREELRTILRPAARSTAEAEAHLPYAVDPGAATEIGLPVAPRCGKCGGELHAYVIDDLILDQCAECFGIWVDRSELERIVGRGLTAPTDAPEPGLDPSKLDRVVGACPVDRMGLVATRVPGKDFALETCPVCRGMWFDRDELAALSEGEVVDWLRRSWKRHIE